MIKLRMKQQVISTIQNFDKSSPLIQFAGIVFIVLGTVLLMAALNLAINKAINRYTSTKNLISGTKSAKKRERYEGKYIKRSTEESGGLEFTYSLWFYVNDWTYKVGKWKHILHKGGETRGGPDSPENTIIKCPGLWLDPTENVLHIYINTFKNPNENITVSNIPMGKWVNCILTVQGRNVDIYINGEFIKRQKLQSLPRQNYGDVTMCQSRGFSGYLSRVKYFNYAIQYTTIEDIIRYGPAHTPCEDTGEIPPY